MPHKYCLLQLFCLKIVDALLIVRLKIGGRDMKECPKCHTKSPNNMKYCKDCGTQLPESEPILGDFVGKLKGFKPGSRKTKAVVPSTSADESVVRKVFRIKDSVPVIATLGNSYFQNLLMSGSVSKNVAALTDTRLYYYGQVLEGPGLKKTRVANQGSVKIADITYSGFKTSRATWAKILKVICLGVATMFWITVIAGFDSVIWYDPVNIGFLIMTIFFTIAGLLLWRKQVETETNRFVVYFAGGGIQFDMRYYNEQDCRDFQELLDDLSDKSLRS